MNDTAAPVAPALGKIKARGKRAAPAQAETITREILGQTVKLTRKVIPAKDIAKKTMVWVDNERDQERLDRDSLDDIWELIKENGVQEEVIGREVGDITEVADGSRRRKTAEGTGRDLPALVGDLTDEQMEYLSTIGNAYKPTSAIEKGRKLKHKLDTQFNGNQSELGRAINKDTKTMRRELRAGQVPDFIIDCFKELNDISTRMGERLFLKVWPTSDTSQKPCTELVKTAKKLAKDNKGKHERDPRDIEKDLLNVGKTPSPDKAPTHKEIAPGCIHKPTKKGFVLDIKIEDEKKRALLAKKVEQLIKEVIAEN